ncbi:MAG TPA: hypothetical protein VME41_18120 [Stellaceae bacterium]|nr:hypothetical protein [Stellaceae bacterium]
MPAGYSLALGNGPAADMDDILLQIMLATAGVGSVVIGLGIERWIQQRRAQLRRDRDGGAPVNLAFTSSPTPPA